MMLYLQRLAFAGILLHGVALGAPALAQKSGGILKMFGLAPEKWRVPREQ
jgi:hypothetical protein